MFDVSTLGQVFTPPNIVKLMLSLRQNLGQTLEPSSGNGSFSREIEGCVSIEIDPSHANNGTLVMDFFDFGIENKFKTIIGNPPYVRYQDIELGTRIKLTSQLFDSRSNLYLFFIEKCLDHLEKDGELIFIVPRDFLKSTSSTRLNKYIYSLGSITHLIDLGDSRVFTKAVPNCIIFRFQQGNFQRTTSYLNLRVAGGSISDVDESSWEMRHFQEINGQLIFSNLKSDFNLSDIAEVKVGAVSGLDAIFANPEFGTREFVYSETIKTGLTRKMIWIDNPEQIPAYLIENKEVLKNRKIRQFDDSNWWMWGRGYPINNSPRIYVNSKTRNPKPFFQNECKHFDGSVLAIFPKKEVDLNDFTNDMNSVPWDDLGFFCDGRCIFAQRSLAHAPMPDFMSKYL